MKKALYELAMIIYLLPLYLIMLLIKAGLFMSKKIVGRTGWRGAVRAYNWIHICGEKLSRHIRRVMPG